jgi:hypothetical protein
MSFFSNKTNLKMSIVFDLSFAHIRSFKFNCHSITTTNKTTRDTQQLLRWMSGNIVIKKNFFFLFFCYSILFSTQLSCCCHYRPRRGEYFIRFDQNKNEGKKKERYIYIFVKFLFKQAIYRA